MKEYKYLFYTHPDNRRAIEFCVPNNKIRIDLMALFLKYHDIFKKKFII